MKTSFLPSIKDQVQGPSGFCLLKLEPSELERIRELIRDQWLYRVLLLSPVSVKQFAAAGISRYHELAHLLDQKIAWPKTARILSPSAVDEIRNFSFMKQLKITFGEFVISDEEEIGWEEIYWRIVRPGSSDIGPLHADGWFWDAGHGKMPEGYERIKVWIAIHCEKGLNGLKIVPGSHLKNDWRYHLEDRDGFLKPQIDEDEKDLNVQLTPTEPGDAVVFHDRLLHGGAANQARTTRVSLEFTMLVKKQLL